MTCLFYPQGKSPWWYPLDRVDLKAGPDTVANRKIPARKRTPVVQTTAWLPY